MESLLQERDRHSGAVKTMLAELASVKDEMVAMENKSAKERSDLQTTLSSVQMDSKKRHALYSWSRSSLKQSMNALELELKNERQNVKILTEKTAERMSRISQLECAQSCLKHVQTGASASSKYGSGWGICYCSSSLLFKFDGQSISWPWSGRNYQVFNINDD